MVDIHDSKFLLVCLALALGGCGGDGGSGGVPTDANHAPVAKAGADRTVDEGVIVELDGRQSTDADGDQLTYRWTRTSGPETSITGADTAIATFAAPSLPGGTSLTFELAVDDGAEVTKDTVVITVNDVTAPGASLSNAGSILGKTESVVVTFDEPMDPASLVLEGTLASEIDKNWNADRTVLTLAPATADGEWTSGSKRTLAIDATDAAGNPVASRQAEWLVKLVFENFQAAETVIGQASFDAQQSNMGGTPDSDSLYEAWGTPGFGGGWLFVPDFGNNRVLGFDGIPTANGATASIVLGQATFTNDAAGTSSQSLFSPQHAVVHEGKLFLADSDNDRVLIWNTLPSASGIPADIVIGQPDMDTAGNDCDNRSLASPASVAVASGKLLVAEEENHRVTIWNSIPTADEEPANLVLGQLDLESCQLNDQDSSGSTDGPAANTLHYPSGVWSDGRRVAVIDSANNRILIWNSFPTVNGQSADVVLGQGNFTNVTPNDDDGDGNQDTVSDGRPTERTVGALWSGIASNGEQLFVADQANHRILIWDTFPTQNFQPADHVLGQSNFEYSASDDVEPQDNVSDGAPDAHTLEYPNGILIVDDLVLVSDGANSRVLVFRSQ